MMRLITAVLLLISCLNVNAKVHAQYITLSLKNVPLERVFTEIKNQAGYNFVYNNRIIQHAKNVDIDVKGASVGDVLQYCFRHQPLTYEIIDNTIVIKDKEAVAEKKDGATVIAPVLSDIHGRVLTGNNEPAVGATVSIKGKDGKLTQGVTTNESGGFTINASPGDVLVISYVGYVSREIKVGGDNNLSVLLQPNINEGEAVVVTALGIKKSVKALTYNVQEVKGEEVTRVPDASFVNSLAGKIAGVTINSSASGIGGSTRVVMRGDKSLSTTGNNNALYVLDGIPLPNLFSGNSTTSNGVYGGKDGGDGISDINPEDIGSISVLTGAASAALYGGMAANGVVLITSKTGSKKKTRISVSNSTSLYKPFILPKFQNTYGTSSPGSFDSWGHKLASPGTYDPADFFQVGVNEINSVSISSGGETNQTYFSAAANNARGVIPNNTFTRYNLTLRNTSTYLDNRITLDLTAMYVKSDNQNMIAQGQYLNPLVPIYLFPRGDDIEKYKVFERYNIDRNFKTQFWPASYGAQNMAMQNPYWTINRDFNSMHKERYILGATLKYNVFDWLDLTGRVRTDNTVNRNEVTNYASTLPLLAANSDNGSYLDLSAHTRNTYADVLASLNKSFGLFGLTVNAGASILDNRYSVHGNALPGSDGAPLSKVPNLFSSDNIIVQQLPGTRPQITQTQSIYAATQLNYKNIAYLDLTARNEWPSQLADNTSTPSLFYPSAGASVIVSDMLRLSPNVLSYLKVRGSYSEVGNPPALYMQNPPYDVTTTGPTLSTNLPFNLVPERTKSTEVGLNAAFLRNKLSLDVTLYDANTYNQVFTFQAPASSGYKNYYINAGRVRNRGIEAALGYNMHIGKVRWNFNASFTLNRNKVLELAGNAVNPFSGQKLATSDTMYMAGIGSASSAAVLGGSVGDIYVNSLQTDPEGHILISNATGGMVAVNNNQLIYAGNPNPRYSMGFRNAFSYKNFTLNFLVSWRIGGQVVSATQAILDGYGVSEASAQARDNGGVLVNGYPVDAQKYYQKVGLGTGVLSQYVYSATNARLREASLSYTLPSKLFHNILQDITVSVIGRNLFMLYNKAPFDPESTSSTGTYFQGIDYFMAPSLRSIGFSVKVNF